jgi:hypothetical protein
MLRRKYLAQKGTSKSGAMNTVPVSSSSGYRLTLLKRQQVNNQAFKRVPDTRASEHIKEVKLKTLSCDSGSSSSSGDISGNGNNNCRGDCYPNAGNIHKDLNVQTQHTYITEVVAATCASLDESKKKPKIQNISGLTCV